MIGIPYAYQHVTRTGRVYATCPVCGKKIQLFVRKDEESMNGREYAAHYAAKHSESGGVS